MNNASTPLIINAPTPPINNAPIPPINNAPTPPIHTPFQQTRHSTLYRYPLVDPPTEFADPNFRRFCTSYPLPTRTFGSAGCTTVGLVDGIL